uniref:Peroxidase n=1 Tax=Quercus lobata TaxID=97700 RepID=A0A7N2LWU1_QUELO
MNVKLSSFLVSIAVLFGLLGVSNGGKLSLDYYKDTCPQALDIVREVTWKHVEQDLTVAAPLLRLHFHDCFIRGCDASILIDSTANNTAEKDAIPNLTLGGFDVIADIKVAVEEVCPRVVSCADIVALAARDSVSFQYKKSLWKVFLGRRDGTISHASDALVNLVPPTFNFDKLKQRFASKGLDVFDLVVLSGAHTIIGDSHCFSFSNRLYNFTGKGYGQDPSLNPIYATYLKTKCKNLSDNTTSLPMDPKSSLSFDTHYYKILLKHKGLFQSDAALLTDKKSFKEVKKLIVFEYFLEKFAHSIKKMGEIQVLTGNEGQIRKNCSVVSLVYE